MLVCHFDVKKLLEKQNLWLNYIYCTTKTFFALLFASSKLKNAFTSNQLEGWAEDVEGADEHVKEAQQDDELHHWNQHSQHFTLGIQLWNKWIYGQSREKWQNNLVKHSFFLVLEKNQYFISVLMTMHKIGNRNVDDRHNLDGAIILTLASHQQYFWLPLSSFSHYYHDNIIYYTHAFRKN